MREYKFRAYDLQRRRMRYDITGFEFFNNGEMSGIFIDGDFYDKKEITLMQYTGLHDKNGKEIYEGDIVESFFVDTDEAGNEIYKYYIMEVKYDEILCSYKIDKFMNLEVIGNVYENKELLNETNR